MARQDVNGGGITVEEEEYRGVVVPEGGLRHRRLSPRVKELFTIDAGEHFPVEIWKRLARLQACRLTDSLAV